MGAERPGRRIQDPAGGHLVPCPSRSPRSAHTRVLGDDVTAPPIEWRGQPLEDFGERALVDVAERRNTEVEACFLTLCPSTVVATRRVLVARARVDDGEFDGR